MIDSSLYKHDACATQTVDTIVNSIHERSPQEMVIELMPPGL